MNIKKIIDGLYFTVGMMLFDPATGVSKTPDELNEDDRYTYDACMGAIETLKAQEPVKPTVEHNLAGQPMWCCGNCGTTLFFKFPRQTDDEDQRSEHRFCHYCGRKVKWE